MYVLFYSRIRFGDELIYWLVNLQKLLSLTFQSQFYIYIYIVDGTKRLILNSKIINRKQVFGVLGNLILVMNGHTVSITSHKLNEIAHQYAFV